MMPLTSYTKVQRIQEASFWQAHTTGDLRKGQPQRRLLGRRRPQSRSSDGPQISVTMVLSVGDSTKESVFSNGKGSCIAPAPFECPRIAS